MVLRLIPCDSRRVSRPLKKARIPRGLTARRANFGNRSSLVFGPQLRRFIRCIENLRAHANSQSIDLSDIFASSYIATRMHLNTHVIWGHFIGLSCSRTGKDMRPQHSSRRDLERACCKLSRRYLDSERCNQAESQILKLQETDLNAFSVGCHRNIVLYVAQICSTGTGEFALLVLDALTVRVGMALLYRIAQF